MLAVLRVGQELVDQPGALVRIGVVQEGDDPLGGGNPAADVEAGAATELGVVGRRRGEDFRLGELGVNDRIDFGGNRGDPARLNAATVALRRVRMAETFLDDDAS
jgi:hypothetical protein